MFTNPIVEIKSEQLKEETEKKFKHLKELQCRNMKRK